MNTTADLQIRDGVAVVLLDNPPVNGISFALRTDLWNAVRRAQEDASVQAIVLAGAGRMFCGGADIKAFGRTPPPDARTFVDVLALFRASRVPVVAAIHGKALGGGLELALGCHYRIAHRDAQVGLPEVTLGLLPGAGGTQRLPRVAGMAKALEVIVGGKPVDADDALRHGIVDAVVDGEIVAAAIAFARTVAGRRPLPDIDARPADRDDDALATARRKAEREQRGQVAPIACIECIARSADADIDAALVHERARFHELMAGPQHAALKYQFFATRTAARIDGVPERMPPRRVERVGVVGAGTMGTGIAMSFASAGIAVVLVESRADALERGLAAIARNYASTVAKGRLSQLDADACIGRIAPSLDFQALADCDLVVEAVFEQMALKKEIFARLDAICRPGAILATNTSMLDVDEIAATTRRPQDVLGLHFFSPAHVMKLLEVVRGARTAPDVLATAMALAHRIGKVAVVVGVCYGFVGNRMLAHYSREAEFLVEEGATPRQVDDSLARFGLAMGRFQMSDLAGLDVGWHNRRAQEAARPKEVRYSRVKDRLCELGRFGQKTGSGWYRYEPGHRTPLHDSAVDDIVLECAAQDGIARREIGDDEIVERTIYALVNEGAHILGQGFAQRASDIDVIYTNGYGFPAWRGGPMFHADAVGLPRVLEAVRRFHARDPHFWQPAPLLERLVAEGRRFQDL